MKKKKYQIKWWYDWLKADTLKRIKMVESLPALKMNYRLLQEDRLTKKDKDMMLSQTMNSLFEDLENEIHFQILEKAKRDDLE